MAKEASPSSPWRRLSRRKLTQRFGVTAVRHDENEIVQDDEIPIPPPVVKEPSPRASPRTSTSMTKKVPAINTTVASTNTANNNPYDTRDDLNRGYDLSPLRPTNRLKTRNNQSKSPNAKQGSENNKDVIRSRPTGPLRSPPPIPSYSIDPWEMTDPDQRNGQVEASLIDDDVYTNQEASVDEYDDEYTVSENGIGEELVFGASQLQDDPTFLMPEDIHPNMEHKDEDILQLRLLAGRLSADWRSPDFMAPALARRIRDFQFAQEKRRKKYGDERPWGILGLYDHLSAIRIDVEWAEDAAWRRANGESYRSWAEFDDSKKGHENRPYFTYLLLFTCTLVLIASIGVNGWKVEPLDVNPMIGPSAETLIKMGAKDTNLIVNHGEGWRLITSAFLHAGLVHFFINMLALWFVGAAIETNHGWVAATIIFSLSAVGGTVLSAIFLPEYITVGASGGIFGFIGSCLADILMNWKLLFCDFVTENGKKHRHIWVVVVLFFDIALNCVLGLTPYVDNFTHVGGMMYGFLCGMSTIERLSSAFFGMEEDVWFRTKQFVVRFSGLILSVVAFITTIVVLMHGDGETNPCPTCTWLSCVPFPPWATESEKWWYCDDCGMVTAEIMTEPDLSLQLNCPNGDLATVDLDDDTGIDRDAIIRNLPTYCRQVCPAS